MVANKSDITIIKLTIYMGTIKAQKKAQTCASKGLPGNHPAKVRLKAGPGTGDRARLKAL
jgi:hypothetical protein